MRKKKPEKGSKADRKESLKAYLAEARSWESARITDALRSRRLAWIFAVMGWLLAVAAVAALAGMTPLKTVEPFVIRVDNATGIVDAVNTLTNAKTNYDEAVNRYFLGLYVRERESFDRKTAAKNYEVVGLMSGKQEQDRYYGWFNPHNPQSPLNQYKRGEKVNVRIRSISFIRPDVALVRYVREEEQSGRRVVSSYWAATVNFKYENPPTKQSDRQINPLGFRVTDYRSDPESLTGLERLEDEPAITETVPERTSAFPAQIEDALERPINEQQTQDADALPATGETTEAEEK